MLSRSKSTIFFLSFFLIFFVFSFLIKDYVKFNFTDSLPKGVYWLTQVSPDKPLVYGDIVLFNHHACCKTDNPDLPPVKYFLKVVLGVPGDVLAYADKDTLMVNTANGISSLKSQEKTTHGFDLSKAAAGPIPSNHYFLWTSHEYSYDSRYYGAVDKKFIEARAELLWEF